MKPGELQDDAIRAATEMQNRRTRKMRQHSRGTWRIEVHNKHTCIEAEYQTVTNDVSNEDAGRIVACVNACDGINPEAIPGMLEALHIVLADNRLMNAMNKEQAGAILDAVAKAEGK